MSDHLDAHLENCTDQLLPTLWPAPVDLPALLARTPIPPRMVIDDWLPCGYATLFAGHGGAGKSSQALHLAACIATGRDWWGLRCATRRVLYLSCEDRADVLHWRLSRILAHEGMQASDLAGLRIVDLVGHDAILYRRDPQSGSGTTAAYAELERLVAETRAEVLFVDGVADTFGANENDRAEVKSYVNTLVRLIGINGAVVLIHHVNKPSAAAVMTSEGYSGSTGWHNSVRARWYLYPEVERSDEGTTPTGDLILTLQKSNLGRVDQSIRLHWEATAHMFVAEREASRLDRQERDEDEQHGIVEALREVTERGDYCPAATTGRRTAHHVLSAAEAFPNSLKSKSNTGRFWRHIEVLRRMGVIHEQSIRRGNRHYTAVLALQGAGDKAAPNAPNESGALNSAFDARRTAPNAPNGAGGYRGCARAPEGSDEGIPWQ